MKLTATYDSDEEKQEIYTAFKALLNTDDEAAIEAKIEEVAKKGLRQPFFRGSVLAQRKNRVIPERPQVNVETSDTTPQARAGLVRTRLSRSKELFG